MIPKAGALSGTQRRGLVDEIRTEFGDCGLDLLDVARLKTNADVCSLAEASRRSWRQKPALEAGGRSDDLVVVITPKLGTPAMWNYDPQWIYKRVGALRLQLAQKFADKHGPFCADRH